MLWEKLAVGHFGIIENLSCSRTTDWNEHQFFKQKRKLHLDKNPQAPLPENASTLTFQGGEKDGRV